MTAGLFHGEHRLLALLLLAALLHAAVIVAVRFQTPPPRQWRTPPLRVTLAPSLNRVQPDPSAPEAAADHLGGGIAVEAVPTATPPPLPEIDASPVPTLVANARTPLTGMPDPDQPPAPEQSQPLPSAQPVADTDRSDENRPEPDKGRQPPPSATQLMRQARQIAQLSPRYQPPLSRGEAPQGTGASTRFSVREAYIEGWVNKVQDWGTRNFPRQARRQGLSGKLRLSVVLRYDGQVQVITLLRGSGHSLLDDAAIEIVRQAAPYAPFPDSLRSEYGDFLTIDRDWQFVQGERLTSP